MQNDEDMELEHTSRLDESLHKNLQALAVRPRKEIITRPFILLGNDTKR
jgi:hypothetical protein